MPTKRRAAWASLALPAPGAGDGAWREVTRHDGLLRVVAPAALVPVLAAGLARRRNAR